jgi:hypothetical protein
MLALVCAVVAVRTRSCLKQPTQNAHMRQLREVPQIIVPQTGEAEAAKGFKLGYLAVFGKIWIWQYACCWCGNSLQERNVCDCCTSAIQYVTVV